MLIKEHCKGHRATSIADYEYILRITNPADSQGTINAHLKAGTVHTLQHNVAGPEFPQNSGSYAFDRTGDDPDPLIGTWQYANYCPESNRINAAIQFNKDITDLDVRSTGNSDIHIQNDQRSQNLINYNITFSGHTAGVDDESATLDASTNLVLSIQPPDDVDRDIYLVFAAAARDSMNNLINGVGFSTNRVGPTNPIVSEVIRVGNVSTPRIINVVRPDVLQVGNNDILVDFNTEVEGVAANAFVLEGLEDLTDPPAYTATLTDTNIYYAATPDPDTSPTAADRLMNQIIVGTTKAKYYLLRIEVTGILPEGRILSISTKDGIINND